jgi:hypothetical protein
LGSKGVSAILISDASEPRPESRVFAVLAVIAMPVILTLLPTRYQALPREVPFAGALALIVTMLAAQFARKKAFWTHAERYTAAVVLPLGTILELILLAYLLRDMAKVHPEIGAVTLLTTAISIWTTNILIFALTYWQLDRGGPTGRGEGFHGRADFSFTRGDPSDGVPADWRPIFADYLALAFNTSAAFSPTDVLPLTPRAKMLMTVQSIISLITVIAVGSRAINILGS